MVDQTILVARDSLYERLQFFKTITDNRYRRGKFDFSYRTVTDINEFCIFSLPVIVIGDKRFSCILSIVVNVTWN